MPVFHFEALDAGSRTIRGIQEAPSMRELPGILQARGLFLTGVNRRPRRSMFALRRYNPADVSVATRHLAIVLQAGFSLSDGLAMLVEQYREKQIAEVFQDVREQVRQGRSFHQALAGHPAVFSPLYVNMVYSGESAGNLDAVLTRLADSMEQQSALISRLQVVLTYPAIMVVAGSVIVMFLMAYVVPMVSQLFFSMNHVLPLPTLILLALSNAIRRFWQLGVLAVIVAGLALYMFSTKPATRLHIDRLVLRVPVWGSFQLTMIMTQFSRTLAGLLAGGVEIVKAFDILKDSTRNRYIAAAIIELRQAITRGEKLAAAMAKERIFSPALVRMVDAGEKTGQLSELLTKAAQIFEHDLTVSVNRFVALLEPAVILVMGGVVGFIVLAILLPIFELSQFVG